MATDLEKALKLLAFLSMLQSTKGGSKDTEQKLLAVIATGVLAMESTAHSVVTTVTPVANEPNASRKSRGSISDIKQ